MRFDSRSLLFLAVMMVAAGMSLARVLVVATGLSKSGFTDYAIVIATGGFISSVISFGGIEATIKHFPRLVANNDFTKMRQESHRLLRVLAMRALAIGMPLAVVGLMLDNHALILMGMACLISLSSGYSGVIASVQRALGSPASLALGTGFRAIFSFAVVSTLAFSGNLWIVVAAEVISAVVGCAISEMIISRTILGMKPGCDRSIGDIIDEPPTSYYRRDGLYVFFTYTLLAIPFYLDRVFVASNFNLDQAAQYAILALFLTAASLLVNTVAQRVGPEAIKMALMPETRRNAYLHVIRWCSATTLAWFFALACIALAFHFNIPPSGLQKYRIETTSFFPIAILGALFCTSLLEFLFIALDLEKRMLLSAGIYLVAIAGVASYVAFSGLGIQALLWGLVLCKIIYLALLADGLRSSIKVNS